MKYAVSRKHGGPDSKKGFSEFYTELSAEDHEALAAAEGAILTERHLGSEERIGRSQKRYRGILIVFCFDSVVKSPFL